MVIADLLHSCSNERVAEAALASIGGALAAAFRAAAAERDVEAGALAVMLVRRFAVEAGERDWRQVTALLDVSDVPVLSGLRFILERTLGAEGCRSAAWAARPVPAAGHAETVDWGCARAL